MTALALDSKIAVVTGAGSGVGRAVARALDAAGATVVLLGRRPEALAESAQGMTQPIIQPLDLTDDAAIAALVPLLTARFGAVDVLVHAAAGFKRAALAQATPADFDALYQSNLRAPFVLTRALLPLLKARMSSVVFMNSSAALAPSPGAGQYSALKAALKSLADTLRAELNDDGVRVASLFLGRVATPMQQAVHAAEGRPYMPGRLLQPGDVAQVVLSTVTLPWTAEVTDVHLRQRMKT